MRQLVNDHGTTASGNVQFVNLGAFTSCGCQMKQEGDTIDAVSP